MLKNTHVNSFLANVYVNSPICDLYHIFILIDTVHIMVAIESILKTLNANIDYFINKNISCLLTGSLMSMS